MERPKKTGAGTCPKCGGYNVDYIDMDYEGDYIAHECVCLDCQTYFREFETVEYDGYALDDVEYSKNGDEISKYPSLW